jgi:hypothetical protein
MSEMNEEERAQLDEAIQREAEVVFKHLTVEAITTHSAEYDISSSYR